MTYLERSLPPLPEQNRNIAGMKGCSEREKEKKVQFRKKRLVFKCPGDPNVISQGCPERRIPNSENSASAKKNILLITVATLPTWRQLAPRFDSNPPKKTWAAAAALQVEKAGAGLGRKAEG